MKPGDFVSYKRHPQVRGVIFDVWQLNTADGERGSVVWETGTCTPVSLSPLDPYGVDLCEPFKVPPKIRKALVEQRDRARATAVKATARAEFLQSFLAAHLLKPKVRR